MPINSNPIQIKIAQVTFDIEHTTITLSLLKQYEEDGELIVLNRYDVLLPREKVIELFQLTGDPTKTIYESVKEVLYQYLIDNNLASGTIV